MQIGSESGFQFQNSVMSPLLNRQEEADCQGGCATSDKLPFTVARAVAFFELVFGACLVAHSSVNGKLPVKYALHEYATE